MNATLQKIYQAILAGDQPTVEEAVQSALLASFNPEQLFAEAMLPAMNEVGRLFEAGEYFVPEMLIPANAMQGGLTILKPLLVKGGVEPAGVVVIGTVQGDMHDIGKNLVSIMLEGAGFEIHDLGVDVPPEKFVQAVLEKQPDIVGLSALLTTTMTNMKVTIDALVKAGLREKVMVIVGGAPVTEEFARQIGADGFAPDASRAAALAKNLVGHKETA